jgi:hypothetical protein
MAKLPTQRSSSGDIDSFLKKSRDITTFVSRQPRLMFCIDATASRQPSWDQASHLQQEMFRASASVASLSVQLCYYRGFSDFYASPWLGDSDQLARTMARVQCEGGHTQIGRLLQHALKEHRKSPVRALVFIGDALEESPDTLCKLAGQAGILKLPLFLFQEGNDAHASQCFRRMAQLSGGAWAHFDASSARTLAELLGAVARYAAGGHAALENQGTDSAKLLLKQLKD